MMNTRIETLIQMVDSCAVCADVGCDHGLVSMGLAKRSDVGHVYATDISKPSLEKLVVHLDVLDEEISQKITPLVTDGISALPLDVDCYVISGMGGERILRILSEGDVAKRSWKQLLLSPHIDCAKVRRAFADDLYDERMVYEDGHFYEILDLRKGMGKGTLSDEEAKYGPYLLSRRDPLLQRKLQKELMRLQKIPKNDAVTKKILRVHDLLERLKR